MLVFAVEDRDVVTAQLLFGLDAHQKGRTTPSDHNLTREVFAFDGQSKRPIHLLDDSFNQLPEGVLGMEAMEIQHQLGNDLSVCV